MVQDLRKYRNIVAENPLFRDIPAEKLEKTVEILEGRIVSYRRGETVHRVYTPFRKFGLLLDGQLNVCTDDISGNRMIMVTVRPGATFGESLAYLRVPEPPVYAVALEDSSVLWLSAEKLREPDAAGPIRELQMRFTAVLAERTLSMNTRIQILSKLTMREKILAFLSSSLTDRTESGLVVSLRREDMASYLGTNRSALSRELSRMKKDGILEYSGNLFHILQGEE